MRVSQRYLSGSRLTDKGVQRSMVLMIDHWHWGPARFFDVREIS